MYVRTECMRMRGRIGIKHVYADDLVVRARSEVLIVSREPDRVYRARMRAYGRELLGLGVIGVVRVEDGLDGPYADVCIWSVKSC